MYHRLAGDVSEVLDIVILVLLECSEQLLPHLFGLSPNASALLLLSDFVLNLLRR